MALHLQCWFFCSTQGGRRWWGGGGEEKPLSAHLTQTLRGPNWWFSKIAQLLRCPLGILKNSDHPHTDLAWTWGGQLSFPVSSYSKFPPCPFVVMPQHLSAPSWGQRLMSPAREQPHYVFLQPALSPRGLTSEGSDDRSLRCSFLPLSLWRQEGLEF